MKTKIKHYNINKRFIIWVETKVSAQNLHEAVDKAEELKPTDFAEFEKPMNDWAPLSGTSVSEEWL